MNIAPEKRKAAALPLLVIVLAVILGVFTTLAYESDLGLDYLEQGGQLQRHEAILAGHAGNPWQYRILAPHIARVIIGLFGYLNIPYPVAVAFLVFRVFIDILVLLLLYYYCRALGLPLPHAVMGMVLLGWGMMHSRYDSDLSFNTFLDVVFYLLASICLLQRKYIWIVPITILAALNRETSGLIPFLFLSVTLFAIPGEERRKWAPVCLAVFVVYLAIFLGLRGVYGRQETVLAYGQHQGMELLKYNVFRKITWLNLFGTLNVVPILAIYGYRKWPGELRQFFWVLVPAWFAIHAFASVMAETRLFLVPQAMVFIPGALLGLSNQPARPAVNPSSGVSGEA